MSVSTPTTIVSIALIAYDEEGPQIRYVEDGHSKTVTVSTEGIHRFATMCSYHDNRSVTGLMCFISTLLGGVLEEDVKAPIYQDEDTLLFLSADRSRQYCISLAGIREISRMMDTISRNRRSLEKKKSTQPPRYCLSGRDLIQAEYLEARIEPPRSEQKGTQHHRYLLTDWHIHQLQNLKTRIARPRPPFRISAEELRQAKKSLKHEPVYLCDLIVDPRQCILIDQKNGVNYSYSIGEGPNHLYLIDGIVCQEEVVGNKGKSWCYHLNGKKYRLPSYMVEVMVTSARLQKQVKQYGLDSTIKCQCGGKDECVRF